MMDATETPEAADDAAEDAGVSIVNLISLRRDLYGVLSLLLADARMEELGAAFGWTEDFHEAEVRRLLFGVAAAARGLLDQARRRGVEVEMPECGEYWAQVGEAAVPLEARQACNSILHASEILTHKSFDLDIVSDGMVYSDRITVRSMHRGRETMAHIDIARFVQAVKNLTEALEN